MNDAKTNPWAEVKRLEAENGQLRVRLAAEEILTKNVRAQLAATEQALQEVQRESAELRREHEYVCKYPGTAAMAVCEAAVAARITWNAKERVSKMRKEMERVPFSFDLAEHLLGIANAAARRAHESAITEYRALTEQPAPDGDGMGFYPGFPPGFDVKRAEKGLAQERERKTV